MAILTKGFAFSDGEQVTSTKLNNLVDDAAFAAGAVDDATLELATSGEMKVKTIQTGNIANSAITTAKIADSTGASDGITTAKIAAGAVTNDKIADGTITQSKFAQGYTLETAKDLTGLSEAEFTGIPSWARRINILLNGARTNSTNPTLVQVSDGSYKTSGYSSYLVLPGSSGNTILTSGTGILLRAQSSNYGSISISQLEPNTYFAGGFINSGGFQNSATQIPSLSSPIESIKIIAPTGYPFTSGYFNISYE
jgi:hypothetical protein